MGITQRLHYDEPLMSDYRYILASGIRVQPHYFHRFKIVDRLEILGYVILPLILDFCFSIAFLYSFVPVSYFLFFAVMNDAEVCVIGMHRS